MMFPIHSWPLHDGSEQDLLVMASLAAFDWLKNSCRAGVFGFFRKPVYHPEVHAVTSTCLFIPDPG